MRTIPHIRLAVALTILAACWSATAPAATTGTAQICAQVYRIIGDVQGDTSLTDDIWGGKGVQPVTSTTLSLFTVAKLSVADHRLTLDDQGWRWDGKAAPIDAVSDDLSYLGKRVLLIASPTLKVRLGESASIGVGSEQPLEYFAAKGNGLYELRKNRQPTGLAIRTAVTTTSLGRYHLQDLQLSTQMVTSRKPLDGTTLNVGEPIVASGLWRADSYLKPGRDYGCLIFPNDGQGVLLIRIRVDSADPPPGEISQVGPGNK